MPIDKTPLLTEEGWICTDDVVYPLSLEELIKKISVVFSVKKTVLPEQIELVDGGVEFRISTSKTDNRITEVWVRLNVLKYSKDELLGVIDKIFGLAEAANLVVFDLMTSQVVPSREIFNQSLAKYSQRI